MSVLNGLLVLDFTTLLPGPMASLFLAEAGAEVVKIERPPHGDDMRGYEPAWGRDSVSFAMLNRGKKSLALDLKDPRDRDRLEPLLSRADVLIEQFRPGVMDRLGLGYETLAARNPKLVYCSITGYGQSGPKRDVAGHDLNYIADTGLLALSMGDARSGGTVPPALVADIAGGCYPAVLNILLALREAERTGRGRHLDIAMAGNLFPFTFWALGAGQVTESWPGNGTDLLTGGTPRYRLYPTRDGKSVAAAPIEQKFWETFCEIIGLEPEWRDDRRDPAGTAERVAALIAAEDAATWAARFAGRDCCCNIVTGLDEALLDAHHRERGLFDHVLAGGTGRDLVALPVPIDPAYRTAPGTPIGSPALGEHNGDYLDSREPNGPEMGRQ